MNTLYKLLDYILVGLGLLSTISGLHDCDNTFALIGAIMMISAMNDIRLNELDEQVRKAVVVLFTHKHPDINNLVEEWEDKEQ